MNRFKCFREEQGYFKAFSLSNECSEYIEKSEVLPPNLLRVGYNTVGGNVALPLSKVPSSWILISFEKPIYLLDVFKEIKHLPDDEIHQRLLDYTSKNVLKLLVEKEMDLRRVYALLKWIDKKYLRKPELEIGLSPENGEFLCFSIVIPSCESEEEWSRISKEVSEELDREGGFEKLKEIEVLCLDVLRELLG